MKDVDYLVRGLKRRSGLYKHRSSYPLISGDTYREMCQFKFDSAFDLVSIDVLVGATGNVFVAAGIAEEFLSKLKRNENRYINLNLIIHNGDEIPSNSDLNYWSGEFKTIYSVNYLGNSRGIFPLPIGLENWSYQQNGIPKYFRKVPNLVRDIKILISFNDFTNPLERLQARETTRSISGARVLSSMELREYREYLSRSKFVLSPPGNGADCHRTWEAMYYGAVPIVKREFWPFQAINLPVLVVNDWNDIEEAIEDFPSDSNFIDWKNELLALEKIRNLF